MLQKELSFHRIQRMVRHKTPILLWLYHNDLVQEFHNLLSPLQDITTLYLACCSENNLDLSILSSLNNIEKITKYPNVGADLYSFINDLTSINTKYFIKIHSKKSFWGIYNKCNWRAMLLDSLLGSKETLIKNLNYIEKYDLGSVGCGPLLYNNSESFHTSQIEELCHIIGLNNIQKREFFAGSMFVGKTQIYKNYLTSDNIKILSSKLELEKGKIYEKRRGTYSHALERVLGYIGSEQKLRACPLKTFRIKILNHKLPYLHIRKMYNNDVYCIEQPNLYGRINGDLSDRETIEIFWKQKNTEILATYQKISTNTYINTRHIRQ